MIMDATTGELKWNFFGFGILVSRGKCVACKAPYEEAK